MDFVSEKNSFVHPPNSDHKGDSIQDEAIHVPGYDPTLRIESKETRRALLKVDFLILPIIVLCFCFLQFDRTNIGNALTDTLRTDVSIDNADINLAQTLFTVGFIVTELPFNMISKHIGPERFLPITMFCWGIATWSQIFLKNASGLYVARFFVGALEGGYIPGFALYISRFYTNQELALRYAIFWASNSFAGALGGPLSIGLLSLRGRGGLHGWQWLFLIEGVLTCVLGIFAYLYFPHNAAKPKSFFGKSFNVFTDREASILVTRVIRNDPTKALRYGQPVLRVSLYGNDLADEYIRTIDHQVAGLHFTSLQANGLNSVGSVCALVWSVTLAFSSDHFRERGYHIALGYLWGAAGFYGWH
ncbi:hypothetical protein FAVG1_12712 [Fusarium avenaceum]|nr:hypothetical protein FAVG1_12712 [Fusarium avenaceum]